VPKDVEITAQNGDGIIRTHGSLGQRGRFFGVRAVIVKDFIDLELLALALTMMPPASLICLMASSMPSF